MDDLKWLNKLIAEQNKVYQALGQNQQNILKNQLFLIQMVSEIGKRLGLTDEDYNGFMELVESEFETVQSGD